MRGSVAVLLAFAMLAATTPSRAGSLDRFEKAHRPKADPAPSRPSKNDSDDKGGGGGDDDDDDDDDAGSSAATSEGGSGGSAAMLLVVGCMVPPFLFACFYPSFRPNRRPYGEGGHYLRPRRGEEGHALGADTWYAPNQRRLFRWGELSLSGFRAFNEQAVYGHDLKLQGFFGMLTLRGSWEHFYEELQPIGFDHLNFYRAHVGANILGPFLPGAEWYLSAGALVMHGDAVTPAFEAGTELRVYPAKPFALQVAATVSVFERGPVLVDAYLHVGITIGPIEIRAGPRLLYQGEAQGFGGPSATVLARF